MRYKNGQTAGATLFIIVFDAILAMLARDSEVAL
jgi:hypothetical protein